jgi:transposase
MILFRTIFKRGVYYIMIKIEFTPEEIAEIRYERFNHPHPRVQLKMDALLLKSQGLKHKQICEIINIDGDTLTSYLMAYKNGGIEALKVINFYKPESKLMEYQSTLEKEFTENPPATVKEAISRIKELTNIERSDVQVGKFLKKNGVKTKKSRSDTCKG